MVLPEYRVDLLPNRATDVGDDSSWERMLLGSFVPGNETSTMWSFRSRERKCMGTKRPGTLSPDSFKTHLNSFRFVWTPDYVMFLSSALHWFYRRLLFIVCCTAFSIHICLFSRGAILLGIESTQLSKDEDDVLCSRVTHLSLVEFWELVYPYCESAIMGMIKVCFCFI